MQTLSSAIGIIVTALCLTAGAANAANISVENAIKNRPDLSGFYLALITTGVINELNPDVNYTVFAPINEAFSNLIRDKHRCFNSMQCQIEVANIVRNHIVSGEQSLREVVKENGGIFSLEHHFIMIDVPSMNHYAADGHDIIGTHIFKGGVLYTVNGVIANSRDLALLQRWTGESGTASTGANNTLAQLVEDK